MAFSVYLVKMVLLFHIYKYDTHPRKYGASSNKKIKDDKKVYSVK